MNRALDVPGVIAGEAVSGTPQERWNDMVAIASVIANRARALGVTPQQVIANTNEFNAYNRAMPAGTADLTGMAEAAMNYVEENGPVHSSTFYATPAAANNLPSGLNLETATTGHQYYSDPQNRAIGTSIGYISPNAYSFAANPENVPTPAVAPQAATGELGPSWTINGVVPQPMPSSETWTDMASAPPVEAPMGAVTANGLLGTTPGLAASATANIAPQVAAIDTSGFDMGRFGVQPASVPDTSNFDMSRFDGAAPQTVSIDPGRFGPIDTSSFDVSRFGTPSINPATNTQSFSSPAPADLGSFPGAMAAQRTHMGQGIYSPQHQDLQANAEQQLQAITQTPSLQSSFVAPTAVTPAEQAVQSAVSPVPASLGSFPSAMMAQRELPGYQLSELDGVTMVKSPTAVQSLETVNVPNQPAISATPVEDSQTIQGPATTPAVTQQAQQAVAQQAAAKQTPSLSSRLSNAINPGSAIGGILGGAALGPIGGIIGAMLGNQAYQGGGLTSPGTTQPGGFLGYGMQNLAGAANGSAPGGSWGIASDGSRVTSQGNGWSTRTNAQGVTTSTSPWGGGAGWFGGDPNDPESYS
jgi:hypothetical protein